MDLLGPRYTWLILDQEQMKRDVIEGVLTKGDNVAILRQTRHAEHMNDKLASFGFYAHVLVI